MKPWQITYAGHTFTDEDIGAPEMVAIQVRVNDGWNSFNPLAGPWHCFVTTAVLVARETGDTVDAVLEEIQKLGGKSVPIPEPRELATPTLTEAQAHGSGSSVTVDGVTYTATPRTEVPFSPHEAA